MSKSATLRVKGLFKLKSPGGKDATAATQTDEAPSFPPGWAATLPGSPAALSPEPGAVEAPSPKKRGLRLPFKMKRKKSKRKECEGGGEVFFPETNELDSFHSTR